MMSGVDLRLFWMINRDLSNALFDILMPVITDPQPFVLPLFVIGTGLLVWGGRKGRLTVAAALLLLLASNAVSELLKLWFERPRPCQALQAVRILVGCSGGSFSLPSSHAANVTAQALLFASVYRSLTLPLFAVAGAVGYSRIYVGVHYPADVAVGALVGLVLGIGFIRLTRALDRRLPSPEASVASEVRSPTSEV